MKQKTKIGIKESVVNMLLSLGVVVIAYASFNYFKPPIEDLFLPIIFLLVFILLELPNKQNK